MHIRYTAFCITVPVVVVFLSSMFNYSAIQLQVCNKTQVSVWKEMQTRGRQGSLRKGILSFKCTFEVGGALWLHDKYHV